MLIIIHSTRVIESGDFQSHLTQSLVKFMLSPEASCVHSFFIKLGTRIDQSLSVTIERYSKYGMHSTRFECISPL
jgi:hypothetical protein